MNPLEWSWFARSLLSLVFVIPAWLSINFFEKTYQIRGEITALWYFLGTTVGMFFFLHVPSSVPINVLIPPLHVLSAIIACGLILGSLTNVFLFSALAAAPNPAIPLAIQGSSTVFVYIVSALLALILPQYFKEVSFNFQQLAGVVLTVAGIILMLLNR